MTVLLIKWPKTPCIWKHTHAQNALWRNITPQAGWFPLIIFINKEEKCNEGWKSLLVCWDLYAVIFVRKGQLSPVPKKTENNNWWCNGPDSDPSPVKNWAFEDSFSWHYCLWTMNLFKWTGFIGIFHNFPRLLLPLTPLSLWWGETLNIFPVLSCVYKNNEQIITSCLMFHKAWLMYWTQRCTER